MITPRKSTIVAHAFRDEKTEEKRKEKYTTASIAPRV